MGGYTMQRKGDAMSISKKAAKTVGALATVAGAAAAGAVAVRELTTTPDYPTPPAQPNGLRVALVHEWLVSPGGGERVVHTMHEMYPDAPIYTLVYDEAGAPAWTKDCDIRTTYLQKWPGAKTHHKFLLSFMPKAWEALDLTDYDLVISSSASCCKGIIVRPDAVHICYCHSPIRYVWDMYHEYYRNAGFVKQLVMPHVIHNVRMWDFQAAQRVDYFISNSDFVAQRIRKYYRRDSTTIYPGIHINEHPVTEEPDDYYLVVSRFIGYKRVDLAVEACNRLGRRLKVIGSGGEEEQRIRELAGPTVEFLGRVSDKEMEQAYSHAKAFLFPGVEDFGMTPVEAMSAGVPVLAYGVGGGTESVVDGQTGLLFHEQTVEGLMGCIERFEREGVSLSRHEIHEYSKRFSEECFKRELGAFIQEHVDDKRTVS